MGSGGRSWQVWEFRPGDKAYAKGIRSIAIHGSAFPAPFQRCQKDFGSSVGVAFSKDL